MPVSFFPGPSTVYKDVPLYVKEAYEKGILSVNHRSSAFAKVMEHTLQLLKDRLNIPTDYEIMFTSSATECWEVIAQSLIVSKSYHFFNGDFGKKWYQYTLKLVPDSEGYHFDLNDELQLERLRIPENTEIICLTQNETSNGTQIHKNIIKQFRTSNPDKLIAVDATSSMGGIALDFNQADIWFASVQKCFGLPAGLGLLVCSPAAIKRAYDINENKHYNSLSFMLDNVRNLQTHYTPNVLGIYLLMKVMEANKNIQQVDERLKNRYDRLQNSIEASQVLRNLSMNEKTRSYTVLAVNGNQELIKNIKKEAEKEGILLGNGYGSYKNDTFRIANFPAIPDDEVQNLIQFIYKYASGSTI